MQTGALSAGMMQQVDNEGDMRSTGELAAHADKLLIVGGTKYNYPGNGLRSLRWWQPGA